MAEKKQNKLILVLTIVLGVLVAGWITIRLYNVHLQNRNREAQTELTNVQNKYNKKLKKQTNKYIATQNPTNDPNVDSIVEQKKDFNILNSASNDFFKTYLTFNSQKSYLARKSKLTNLATDNILNSKEMFDDGLDSTGHSMITALGIDSKFDSLSTKIEKIDNNSIQGIVNVKFEAKNSMSNSYNASLRVYQVTFDKQQNKFTEIKLMQVSSENTNLDDDSLWN